MLHTSLLTLAQILHTIGFVVVLYGALALIFTLMGQAQPLALLKSLAVIVVGSWFAGLLG